MDFPECRFDYETLATLIFFESIDRLINVKIHLHHSYVTGRIYGYAHDFCNMKVRKNQSQFSCIAHNFFGFDMFSLIKGLSVWGTTNINIFESGLTIVNFANIGLQVKFIDTMKCYFSRTWKKLNGQQERKVLDFIVSGKGGIPYEKIDSVDSLNIKPENGIFFSKDEFYSTLKRTLITLKYFMRY